MCEYNNYAHFENVYRVFHILHQDIIFTPSIIIINSVIYYDIKQKHNKQEAEMKGKEGNEFDDCMISISIEPKMETSYLSGYKM